MLATSSPLPSPVEVMLPTPETDVAMVVVLLRNRCFGLPRRHLSRRARQ